MMIYAPPKDMLKQSMAETEGNTQAVHSKRFVAYGFVALTEAHMTPILISF